MESRDVGFGSGVLDPPKRELAIVGHANGLPFVNPAQASMSTEETHSLWNCPVCGGTIRVVERLSAPQLLLPSPPQPTGAQLEPLSASSTFARASARTQVPCLICPETLGRLYLQPPPDASLQSFAAPPRLKSRRSCSD